LTDGSIARPRPIVLPRRSPRRVPAEAEPRTAWGAVRDRWYRPVAFGLTTLLLVGAAAMLAVFWKANAAHAGEDLVHYLDGVRRWWATGSPYLPNEIAGDFDYEPETFLHPPVSVLFFAPWLVLHPILWWAVPIAITTALVVAWRPAPWTWPLIAFGLCQPQLHQALLWGNTNLWLTAALAVALIGGPWAALFLVKPSLGLLAIVGMRRRSWWVAVVVIALLCVPFGMLWIDWANVILNSPADPTYGLRNLPWVLIPVIAWAGRQREIRVPTGLARSGSP
jgi:hypothetical protein